MLCLGLVSKPPSLATSATTASQIVLIIVKDGSCLAELLQDLDYVGLGLKRRPSSFNTIQIDHLCKALTK
ncbi:hypothetical protein SynNOUM97013_00224 [Synechococcus sp. NOUM97013]|nr:hypothetical protein SynNOUM97013_00224 [Synechococcus sp. NOUM97013]